MPWPVVLLTLLGFALQVWRLPAKSLWWDESLSLNRAQRSVQYVLSGSIDFPGVSTRDQHPPLYFVVLKGATALGGESDVSLRLPSALFAATLVPLLYSLGRRLGSRQTGLHTAALAAVSPFYVWYAQEARMYTMVTALTAAATYALWRALSDRRLTRALAWMGCTALAVSTHYLASLVFVGHILVTLVFWHPVAPTGRPSRAAVSRLAIVVAFLVAIAVAILVLRHLPIPGLQPEIYEQRLGLCVMLVDALNSFSLGLSVRLEEAWPLLLPFGTFCLLGWASLVRRAHAAQGSASRDAWVRMSAIITCTLLPVVLLWGLGFVIPFYINSRYAMGASPTFYLSVAIGLEEIGRRRRIFGLLGPLLLLSAMGYSLHRYYADPYYASKEDYRGAAQYIQERELLGDVIVLTGPESLTAFDHYYRGRLTILTLPEGPAGAHTLSQQLAEARQSHRRVWHIVARTAFSDPNGRTAHWLGDHATRVSNYVLPSCGYRLSVAEYLSDPPFGEAPPGAIGTFDGRLRLVAAALRYRKGDGTAGSIAFGETATIPAGQPVAIDLRWAVDAPLPELAVSVRLVQQQASGLATWLQADQLPLEDLPSTVWPVGQSVDHSARLEIPADVPPGRYAVRLVVYEKDTGAPFTYEAPGIDAPFVDLAEIELLAAAHDATDVALPDGVRRPFALAFGRRLSLSAYWPVTVTAVPGSTVNLHLFWRAQAPPDSGLRLRLHWQDEQGRVWHDEAAPVLGTGLQPADWPLARPLHGVVAITVPGDAAPGPHRLHLLVQGPQGEYLPLRRLGVFAGHDLLLGTIQVETP